MSAPTTHDPRVVETADGAVWVRCAVTQEGRGLYAAARPPVVPEYVMASLEDLAEHGIKGQGATAAAVAALGALPVPVAGTQAERVAELEALRARLLELLPRDACMTRGTPNALAAAQGEYGAWELVAEVLGVALPYRPAERPIPYALIEQANPAAGETHACNMPLMRRLDCGHCPHEVCEVCGRCPHSCRCAAETAPDPRRAESVEKLRGLLARQRDREDHFVSPLHRDYRTPHDMPRPSGACDVCGDGPDRWCPDCGACRRGCHGGDTSGCAHLNAPWAVTP
jgi:hypothetical protein